LDNYEIWCVLDDQYLQKYEPVLLTTGERCHQSAEVFAQYSPNRQEFLLVRTEEKGKTEQNNIVVSILDEYDPKTNPKLAASLIASKQKEPHEQQQQQQQSSTTQDTPMQIADESSIPVDVIQTTNSGGHNNASSTLSPQTTATTAQPVTTTTSTKTTAAAAVSSASPQLSKYDECKNSFDIFIQVLSSQCLNVEFLVKIREIQDEYFKPSLEFIENLLAEKYTLLHGLLVDKFLVDVNVKLGRTLSTTSSASSATSLNKLVELNAELKSVIDSRPVMLLVDTSSGNERLLGGRPCEGLSYHPSVVGSIGLLTSAHEAFATLLGATLTVKLEGEGYNPETLLSEHASSSSKEFCLCERVYKFLSLLHSLRHFKFNLYELCGQKV
jgi:hypothetical protein